MILAALFLILAILAAIRFPAPRRDRDWSRGYRELRDAAINAEQGAALWRRQAERGKRETEPGKVVKIDERRRQA